MMKNFTKLCLSLIFLLVASLGLQAQSTSLTLDMTNPETLGALLGTNKYTVQNLTLKGKMGGADVDVIRDIVNNGALTELNLSAVTIVGGTTYSDMYPAVRTTIDNELSMNMFAALPNLTSIVLPRSITKIGDGAIYFNKSLKSVVVPEGVTSIGKSAIAACETLESITLAKSVTHLDQGAVSNNKALKALRCLNSTPTTLYDAYVFSGINMAICTLYVPFGAFDTYRNRVVWTKFTTIVEAGPVKPETRVKTVNVTPAGSLPSLLSADEMINVTDLIVSGNLNGTDIKAIRAMENLFVLDIQNANIVAGGDAYINYGVDLYTSDNEISNNMFYNMTKLSEVKMPTSINKIGELAFYGCANLLAINIPENVTAIDEYAFTSCYSAVSHTLSPNLTSIGKYAFANNTKMTTLVISDKITKLGGSAFARNPKLTTVSIGKGITTLEDGMFTECTALTDVKLGENITLMEQQAFSKCTALESIVLPDNLGTIDNSAFAECTALKKVTIGSQTNKIFHGVFYGCTALEEVHCRNAVPATIYFNTFYNVPVTTCKLFVPTGSLTGYSITEYWKDFLNIVEEELSGIHTGLIAGLTIIGDANGITIETENPVSVTVYSLLGRTVYQGQIQTSQSISLEKGIYLVKAGKETLKVAVN